MSTSPTPDPPTAIEPPLVRRLLAEQHPDLADQPVRLVASGWDNVVYRLGSALVVRLPRHDDAAELITNEQRWLPHLAPRLTLPVPVPARVGVPGAGYPWPWTIAAWLPGSPAAPTPPLDDRATAETLGAFIRSLHEPAPPDAPANPFRGIPLADRHPITERHLAILGRERDVAPIRARWERLVATPPARGTPVWLHGDLHPRNLLVDDGRISAVLDFGDLTAGDRATDLAVAWMLLPVADRAAFRIAAGDVDDDTWRRAEAWALAFALAFLASGDTTLHGIGDRALTAVMDPPSESEHPIGRARP